MPSSWTELLDRDLLKLAESPSATSCRSEKLVPGERREVAILFLDIQGFTALSENLDHETVHRLTTSLMGALSRIIENYGGYVDKFEGDRVMALFGAREAAEDDCTRAVTSGLRMLELIREVGPAFESGGADIGARVGVSFGSATVAPDAAGHLTAMGDEVNVASRLEDAADSNCLFASGKVHDLCFDSFEWKDLGALSIRGRTKPVRTWRADGFGGRQIERWQRVSALKPAPLLGREPEMAALEECWKEQELAVDRSIRGSPRHIVAVVQGVAGIGKSRLIHEFISAHRECLELLASRTASFDQPPWWLWTGLLKEFSGEAPSAIDSIRASVAALASEAGSNGEALLGSLAELEALLVPGAPGKPEDITPEAWSSGIQVAIRNLVRACCVNGGKVAILLEDMQWVDSASRDAVEFLLCNCEVSTPLLILVSSRSDGESCSLPLRPVTEGYARVHTINLRPLDSGSARLLMRHKLGLPEDRALPGGLEERILERGEGNPYYIEEMLSELVGKGVLVPGEKDCALGPPLSGDCIPTSIAGLIQSRIDRLPSDLRRALQIASVLGTEFDESIFTEMCRLEGLDAGLALEGLSSFRLVDRRRGGEGRVMVFRSILARDAMYENLLHHNRTVLHRRAAKAMEESGADDVRGFAGALAWHWHAGGEVDKALRCGIRAADALGRSFQDREATIWVERLMEWLSEIDEGSLRDELLLRILLVRIMVLENLISPELKDSCEEAILLARRLGLEIEEAEAGYVLGAELLSKGRTEEGMRLVEEGLRVFESAGRFERAVSARFSLADTLRQQGKLDQADEVAQVGLAEARRIDSPREISACLAAVGAIAMSRGELDCAGKAFEEALEIDRKLGLTRRLHFVLSSLGVLHGMKGEIREALACFEESMRVQAELGTRRGEGSALNNMGNCYITLGQSGKARECFEKALLIHMETGTIKSQAITLVNLGNLASESGDLDKAIENYQTAIEIQRKAGNEPSVNNARCLLAGVRLKQGRIEDAKRTYLESAAAAERMNLGRPLASPVSDLRDQLIAAGVRADDLPVPEHWTNEDQAGKDGH